MPEHACTCTHTHVNEGPCKRGACQHGNQQLATFGSLCNNAVLFAPTGFVYNLMAAAVHLMPMGRKVRLDGAAVRAELTARE